MAKRLCIDCGNTRLKAAVMEHGLVVAQATTDYHSLAALNELLSKHQVHQALMVSTTHAEDAVARELEQCLPCRLQRLTASTPVPLAMGYRTPDTLGRDRVATAVGAWIEFTGCNLLVIDAGTAITSDVVLADGTFLGGSIAPGVDMRLRAMHDYTSRLPLVEAEGDTPLVGYDTTTALRSGAVLGAATEVEGRARTLKAVLGQLKVMLTGGNAELLNQFLPDGFATVDAELMFKGLDAIIDFNDNTYNYDN